MVLTFAAWVGLAVALLFCYFGRSLRRNIRKAESSGVPYVIFPFHILSVPWAIVRRFILPLLDRLPGEWTAGWIPFVGVCFVYRRKADMFCLDSLSSNAHGSMAMGHFRRLAPIPSRLCRLPSIYSTLVKQKLLLSYSREKALQNQRNYCKS